jgi:trehalose utilization protein/lysophospholipase L1-like esterase
MRQPTALAALLLAWLGLPGTLHAQPAPVRVVVWDEQQPDQKKAYSNFLGNEIAEHLRGRPGLKVRSVRQDDARQGLGEGVLDDCDVLVWWGHVRQREVKPELGRAIVERIRQGKLSLIALHSAHWSTPFIEAMNERAVADALATLTPEERKTAKVVRVPPLRYAAPRRGDPLTPSVRRRAAPDGTVVLEVQLPNCCFPAWRADRKPSHVRVLLPKHPPAAGLPEKFDLPHTEMYDEPFHVPPPDEVVFEERWDAGERFRSGCVWKLGKGRVFYFRPGHETFGVYRRPEPLKIVENAARWLAAEQRPAAPAKGDAFARWEKAVAAFERQDREQPPPKGAVVFVGSSSIRLWDLGKSFPGLGAVNRGFGGSQLADSVHFAPRLVLKHEPRTVVLYAGDNDIAAGKGPEEMAADFRAFAAAVQKALSKTRVVFLSIKPSPRRWALVEKVRRANALVEAACKGDTRLLYLDVFTPLLGEDGRPRPELFAGDALHLNARGYAVWTSVLLPHLK